MRFTILLFALISLNHVAPDINAAPLGLSQLHPGRNDITFEHKGRQRTAIIVVPTDGTSPEAGWPLVMMVHGAGGSAKQVMETSGWAELGKREKFVTVFPNGTPKNEKRTESFLGNPQTWNSGGKSSLAAGELSAAAKEIHDVGFLGELITCVQRELRIDPNRIYVAGHSNGAGMAYRFGFERSDLVAAIGVVAGTFYPEPKPLPHPVSLIQIVGDKDPFTPMAGGTVTIAGRKADMPPAMQSPERWASMLGLHPDARIVQDDEKLKILEWGPDSANAGVRAIIIKGHGHAYPSPSDRFHPAFLFGPTVKTLNASDTIWKFFREHARK
jgi:polyhydroxybutyrate depolymerase